MLSMYLAIVFSFNPFSFYYNPGNTIQKTNPSDDLLSDRLERKILSNYSKQELDSVLANSTTWLNQIKPKTRSQKSSQFGIDSLKSREPDKATVISSNFQNEIKSEESKNLLNSTDSKLSFDSKNDSDSIVKIQTPTSSNEIIDINAQVHKNSSTLQSSKSKEAKNTENSGSQNFSSVDKSDEKSLSEPGSVSLQPVSSNISLNPPKMLSSASGYISAVQDLDTSLVVANSTLSSSKPSTESASSQSKSQASSYSSSVQIPKLNSQSKSASPVSLNTINTAKSSSSIPSVQAIELVSSSKSSSLQSSSSLSLETVSQTVEPPKEESASEEELWQKKVNAESSEYIEWTVDDLKSNIQKRCEHYGCNSTQLIRVAWCESKFDPYVVGAGKYHGLFQFYTPTFLANSKRVGISKPNIYNPYQQIEVATYMFANGQARQWGCK